MLGLTDCQAVRTPVARRNCHQGKPIFRLHFLKHVHSAQHQIELAFTKAIKAIKKKPCFLIYFKWSLKIGPLWQCGQSHELEADSGHWKHFIQGRKNVKHQDPGFAYKPSKLVLLPTIARQCKQNMSDSVTHCDIKDDHLLMDWSNDQGKIVYSKQIPLASSNEGKVSNVRIYHVQCVVVIAPLIRGNCRGRGANYNLAHW